MKRLIAVICAVAMMLAMAIPAMANPSIVELAATGEGVTEDGVAIVVAPVDVDAYANDTVKDVVTKVNGSDDVLTPAEIAEMLGADNAPADIADYHQVSVFMDIVATDGSEIEGPVTMQVKFDALVGAESLENYLIQVIDPTTGEIYYLSLDPEQFDAETGMVTVTFPVAGPFSLIQK